MLKENHVIKNGVCVESGENPSDVTVAPFSQQNY